MKRAAQAVWKGTGLEGKGTLTTPSGVFKDQPYSFVSRFKNEDGTLGTNPEELVAAAHAGCFNMALSFQLVGAGFTAEKLNTTSEITMENFDGDFKFTHIQLNMKASVPGISKEKFEELATVAKKNCPISKALEAVEISLKYELE